MSLLLSCAIISSLSAALLNFKVNLHQRKRGKPISILYSCKGQHMFPLGPSWHWQFLVAWVKPCGSTWWGLQGREGRPTICTNPLIFQGLNWCTHHLAPLMKQTYHSFYIINTRGALCQLLLRHNHYTQGLNWTKGLRKAAPQNSPARALQIYLVTWGCLFIKAMKSEFL